MGQRGSTHLFQDGKKAGHPIKPPLASSAVMSPGHNTDVPVCKSFAGKEQTVGSRSLWNHIVVACIAVFVYFII